MLKPKLSALACGMALLALSAASASAGSIVFTGTSIDVTGTGQGTVLTILKLQETGSGKGTGDGHEFGEVSWDGSMDVLGSGQAGDDTVGGSSASQTYSVGTVFGSSGDGDLGICFNIAETGGGSTVTINNLTLLLFDSAGNSLGTLSWTGSETLAVIGGSGAGSSGWLWRVEGLGSFLDDPDNRFGLRVSYLEDLNGITTDGITLFDDGPEQFFVTSLPSVVPLPPAALLGLMGLGGLFVFRRRRRSR